ncbi:hypothetical protein CYLTODRAFT_458547 [Cylindrobasidium torrendii FP15055 ss-10]|uniref:Large ribosomal subunit protein eL42 n=1 Tax=Cylindrobasidium torrendii FP15055 ss-10 TaxID=1314674 RepID=A0A0D7AX45_9AGAR|nr:hypothetical protein CYLTODRAFT_458547 [Cylindrobasidium torrendii FP15055 ss-10]
MPAPFATPENDGRELYRPQSNASRSCVLLDIAKRQRLSNPLSAEPAVAPEGQSDASASNPANRDIDMKDGTNDAREPHDPLDLFPRMYILEPINEQSSGGTVEKIITDRESLKRFIDIRSPGAYQEKGCIEELVAFMMNAQTPRSEPGKRYDRDREQSGYGGQIKPVSRKKAKTMKKVVLRLERI